MSKKIVYAVFISVLGLSLFAAGQKESHGAEKSEREQQHTRIVNTAGLFDAAYLPAACGFRCRCKSADIFNIKSAGAAYCKAQCKKHRHLVCQ